MANIPLTNSCLVPSSPSFQIEIKLLGLFFPRYFFLVLYLKLLKFLLILDFVSLPFTSLFSSQLFFGWIAIHKSWSSICFRWDTRYNMRKKEISPNWWELRCTLRSQQWYSLARWLTGFDFSFFSFWWELTKVWIMVFSSPFVIPWEGCTLKSGELTLTNQNPIDGSADGASFRRNYKRADFC